MLNLWSRHEFQPDAGNLSHLHMIIWNMDVAGDPPKRDIDISITRICATIDDAFDYIENIEDRTALTALAWKYQQHRCNTKCTTASGACRYRCPFDLTDYPVYDRFPAKVPSHLEHLMLDLCLCSISESGELVLTDILQGGKLHPSRGCGNERTSPFIPLNFEATQSHSNTQVPPFLWAP